MSLTMKQKNYLNNFKSHARKSLLIEESCSFSFKKMNENDVTLLRKKLREIREIANQNNIPITVEIICEKIKQDSTLFWSNTFIHSILDDLRQLVCDGGKDAVYLRIEVDELDKRIPLMNIASDQVDYDYIYLFH